MIFGSIPRVTVPPPLLYPTHLLPFLLTTHTHTYKSHRLPIVHIDLCTAPYRVQSHAQPISSLSLSPSSSSWILHILSSPPSGSIFQLSALPPSSTTMTSTISGKTTRSTPARRLVEIVWIMCVCGRGRGVSVLF